DAIDRKGRLKSSADRNRTIGKTFSPFRRCRLLWVKNSSPKARPSRSRSSPAVRSAICRSGQPSGRSELATARCRRWTVATGHVEFDRAAESAESQAHTSDKGEACNQPL